MTSRLHPSSTRNDSRAREPSDSAGSFLKSIRFNALRTTERSDSSADPTKDPCRAPLRSNDYAKAKAGGMNTQLIIIGEDTCPGPNYRSERPSAGVRVFYDLEKAAPGPGGRVGFLRSGRRDGRAETIFQPPEAPRQIGRESAPPERRRSGVSVGTKRHPWIKSPATREMNRLQATRPGRSGTRAYPGPCRAGSRTTAGAATGRAPFSGSPSPLFPFERQDD